MVNINTENVVSELYSMTLKEVETRITNLKISKKQLNKDLRNTKKEIDSLEKRQIYLSLESKIGKPEENMIFLVNHDKDVNSVWTSVNKIEIIKIFQNEEYTHNLVVEQIFKEKEFKLLKSEIPFGYDSLLFWLDNGVLTLEKE